MSAVLFDMDGTLLRLDVDIEEVRLRLAALFAPHGVTRPFRPILRRISEAAAEAGKTELRAAGLAILDEWELKGARVARPRAGAVAAARTLAEQGTKLGIVTDNGRACVETALRAAGFDPAWFQIIVTRDDVPAPKPDPAGVLLAARTLGAPMVYLGDHPKDVDAGRAAARTLPGIRVLAVRGGHASDADLAKAGADAVLGSVGELLANLTAPG
jgi:HAD superfamily hydrolase (TIGR01549 family)